MVFHAYLYSLAIVARSSFVNYIDPNFLYDFDLRISTSIDPHIPIVIVQKIDNIQYSRIFTTSFSIGNLILTDWKTEYLPN